MVVYPAVKILTSIFFSYRNILQSTAKNYIFTALGVCRKTSKTDKNPKEEKVNYQAQLKFNKKSNGSGALGKKMELQKVWIEIRITTSADIVRAS